MREAIEKYAKEIEDAAFAIVNQHHEKETDDGNTMPCVSKSEGVIQILQLPYCHVFKSAHLCTMQGSYFSLSFKSKRM